MLVMLNNSQNVSDILCFCILTDKWRLMNRDLEFRNPVKASHPARGSNQPESCFFGALLIVEPASLLNISPEGVHPVTLLAG